MYKDEREKLKRYRQSFDEIDIPEELINDRIHVGFKKAKSERRKGFRLNWLPAAAIVMILLVGFISAKHLIEKVRDNKGLISAIEHDYFEEINKTVQHKDVEFTVDGIIADEKGVVIFYTIQSDKKRERMELRDTKLQDHQGNDLELGSVVYGGDMESTKKSDTFSGMIEAFYNDPNDLTDFNLVAEVTARSSDGTLEDSFNHTFTIPFSIKKDLSPSKIYEINETVVIEGQKITFLRAIISPIRTEIDVKIDPANTKKLLNFDDLRLVDDHGETWGKINNGVTATSRSDDEQTIYLQSNYFKNPKELFIELNKIQAIDKEASKVIVDPVEEKIIQQPKGDLLKKFRVEASYLVFEMDDDQEEAHNTFGFHTLYQDGEEISYSSNYFRKKDNSIEVGVGVDRLDHLNERISLEISHYPIWITGSERVRVK